MYRGQRGVTAPVEGEQEVRQEVHSSPQEAQQGQEQGQEQGVHPARCCSTPALDCAGALSYLLRTGSLYLWKLSCALYGCTLIDNKIIKE